MVWETCEDSGSRKEQADRSVTTILGMEKYKGEIESQLAIGTGKRWRQEGI